MAARFQLVKQIRDLRRDFSRAARDDRAVIVEKQCPFLHKFRPLSVPILPQERDFSKGTLLSAQDVVEFFIRWEVHQ